LVFFLSRTVGQFPSYREIDKENVSNPVLFHRTGSRWYNEYRMCRFWYSLRLCISVPRWLSSCAAAVMVFLAAWFGSGCSIKGVGEEPRSAGAVVAAVPSGLAAEALRHAAEVYRAETGTVVIVESLPADRYADQAAADLIGGLGRYDILLLPAEELPRWASYHALRRAPDPQDEAGLEPWLQALETGQGRFGLPTQPDPLALWARVDLLEAAGMNVPADPEALVAAAQVLHQPPEHAGIALAGKELSAGRDLAALVFGFAGTSPAHPLAAPGGDVLDRALAAYAGLGRLAQPEMLVADSSAVIGALAQGKAAFGFAPLSAAEKLLDCGVSVCQQGEPLLQPFPLPGADPSAPVGNLSAWVVPLRAPHPNAAAAFLRWLVAEEGARVWAESGAMPAHRVLLRTMSLPGAAGTALVEARVYRVFAPKTPAVEAWRIALDDVGQAALAGDRQFAVRETDMAAAIDALQKAARQAE
jgi:ABC-type glycerol-3-phosphate transport system substrate-binding protein